jgi:hypothetical protein
VNDCPPIAASSMKPCSLIVSTLTPFVRPLAGLERDHRRLAGESHGAPLEVLEGGPVLERDSRRSRAGGERRPGSPDVYAISANSASVRSSQTVMPMSR